MKLNWNYDPPVKDLGNGRYEYTGPGGDFLAAFKMASGGIQVLSVYPFGGDSPDYDDNIYLCHTGTDDDVIDFDVTDISAWAEYELPDFAPLEADTLQELQNGIAKSTSAAMEKRRLAVKVERKYFPEAPDLMFEVAKANAKWESESLKKAVSGFYKRLTGQEKSAEEIFSRGWKGERATTLGSTGTEFYMTSPEGVRHNIATIKFDISEGRFTMVAHEPASHSKPGETQSL